jgi:hypothetical protein
MSDDASSSSPSGDLSGTVLDNLRPGSALQPGISAALNAALKSQLADMAAASKLAVILGLIDAMPSADLVAVKDLSLQAFVKQQLDSMLGPDPAMKTAVDNEIASLASTDTVGSLLKLNQLITANPLLSGIVADAQLTALLETSKAITSAMQSQFVSLYDANTQPISDFWGSVAKDPILGPAVPWLQLTLQLGTLTLNNPTLVAAIQEQLHPESIRDLTAVSAAQLVQIMSAANVKVPSAVADTTTASTLSQYADIIVGQLKTAFPTTYIGQSFSNATDPTNRLVGDFLTKSTDFDFATSRVDSYIKGHPSALAGLSSDQVSALTDRLKAAQRVFQVIPDGDVMQTLIGLGLDSSYEIASTSSGAFVGQFADKLGGEDQSRQIYANASTINAVTSTIVRLAQENSAQGLPHIISGGQQAPEVLLDNNIPDWQTLFGATSTCQCQQCHAVDGPAAYFVSLLEFLRKMGKNAKKNTPLDVLMARRPDLGNLKLSCANCDTELPYVDLVNEILESYVANGKLTQQTAHNTPSDATTATLDVTPDYMQTPDAITAYETLAGRTLVYPFSLPFDRYLETQRNYLNFLGVSRYQLLRAFALPLDTAGPKSAELTLETQLAAESLLISDLEYALITQQNFSGRASVPQGNLCYYYGYQPSDPWQKDVVRVPEFLNRTGLAFSDLVDQLETHYLNPTRLDPSKATTLLQSSTTDLCDTTTMTLQNAGAFLACLPAFVRLWKKLEWHVSELDYALRAFGIVPGTISATAPCPMPAEFIPIVAQLKQLRTTLKLSVSQTVSLWQEIDTDGRASAFMSLFQNKAVLNPPDSAFQLVYQVPLASLPSALPTKWPSDGTAQNQASYTAGRLQFIGSMTDSQQDDLLSWAGSDDAAILAVELLYAQHWYKGIDVVPGASIADHLNAISAALRVSASDLTVIGQDAGLLSGPSGTWATLNVANLSTLERYSILAQSLSLSVTDLITLKNLSGLQPFQVYRGSDRPATDPMLQFVTFAQQVAASQFTVGQLAYLYGPPTTPPSPLAPLQTAQDVVISTILVGLQNVAAANVFAPDSTGASLRKELSQLLPSALQLEPTMALIAGNVTYSSPLPGLPTGLTLPVGQVSFLTTITIAGSVTAGDTISLTVTPSSGGSAVTVGYAVQSGDTFNAIAAGLAFQINHNTTLAAAAISATTSGATINVPAPTGSSGSPGWTSSSSPAPGSEIVTIAGALVCTGAMSDATLATLNGLPGTNPAFTAAAQDLYNQAQDVVTNNLVFLALPGPYATPLGALPSSVTLPSEVLYCVTATIGGTITAGNIITLTCAAVPSPVKYTVQPGDTATTIASALAAQVNGQFSFGVAGLSATATASLIDLFAPSTLIPPPHWTATVLPGTASIATETVTVANSLVSNGPMLNSTRMALLALSSDASFTSAVNALYAQAWGSASVTQSVIANLIDISSTSTPSDRYNYVLSGLLVYLTDTESRNLVKQNLAQALSIDPSVVDLLLEGNPALGTPRGLLPSSADPTQSAMSDFLGGLSATYYSSMTPGPQNLQVAQIDPGVDFTVPASGFGCAQWTGKLLPPTTGAYRFALVLSGTTTGGTMPTLVINEQTITFSFNSAATTWEPTSAPINLTAGNLYDTYLLISGAPPSATIQLQWSIAPLGTFSPIPALAFMPCFIPFTDLGTAASSYSTLALLYRIAVLVSGFSMAASDIAYLSTHASLFAGTNPATGASATFSLSGLAAPSVDTPALLNQWQRLNAIYTLVASMPTGNTSVFDIFAAATAAPATSPPVNAAVIQQILTTTGWNPADVLSLTGSSGFNCDDDSLENELLLVRMASCISIGTNIGVSAQKLFQWANPTMAITSYEIAQDITHTVKAKYDDSAWLQIGQPLNDKLRKDSKNALVAYVIYQQLYDSGYRTPDDLYGFFLIDVEMTTCMETSRIVQASAAVQLFVQRCLLNLESGAKPSDLQVSPSQFTSDDVQEWGQYRQNYRVWQAAVDVFLRPEDYWQPEHHLNKSPFFETLETTLLQSNVTEESVEAAYLTYLQSLQQVARLEIVGIYGDDDSEAGTQTTHLIGRTFATPYVYFHRKLDNKSYAWSPWEQINADIGGNNLIPVVWNRRLFLFWPLYKEMADPTKTPPASASTITDNSIPPAQPSEKTLQIQLAWTEYQDGTWAPKQVTAGQLAPVDYRSFTFQASPYPFFSYAAVPGKEGQDGLTVTGYQISYLNEALGGAGAGYLLNLLGTFSFDGSQGSVTTKAVSPDSDISLIDLVRSCAGQYALLHSMHHPFSNADGEFQYQDIMLYDAKFGLVFSEKGGKDPTLFTILSRTSGSGALAYDVTFPQRDVPTYAPDVSEPTHKKVVVLADNRRSYYVVSSISSFNRLPVRDPNSAVAPGDVSVGSVYLFNHYHPWVGEFIRRYKWKGISYLLDPSTQALNSESPPNGYDRFDFSSFYKPTNIVAKPYPRETVDFNPIPSQTSAPANPSQPPGDWAYSLYNKEAFFLAVCYIARRLSSNRQYRQAQQWFHYIFNPTQDPKRKGVPSGYDTNVPNGYWNYLPFNKLHKDGGLDALLQSLNGKDNTLADTQWNAWVNDPFDPDAVASLRLVAYQKAVVMMYLDNLIAWGDSLFSQNTREAINESIQIYILGYYVYGTIQQNIPQPGTVLDLTYNELANYPGKDAVNQLGNREVQLENAFPFMFTGSVSKKGPTSGSIKPPSTPYFCTPADTKLQGYYNTIMDRLYKVRHCMNIQGQVEQLPLFGAPINPAFLVAAEQAGVDLSSVLNDINAGVPYYRFKYMMAKTLELCTELCTLGALNLSAREKYDAEGMARLRAGQELAVERAILDIKNNQIQQANDDIAALQATLAVATARQAYYQNLVKGGLSNYETQQVTALGLSEEFKLVSQSSSIGAAGLAVVPQIAVGVNGAFGSPSAIVTFGGEQMSGAANAIGSAFNILADLSGFVSSMSGLMGGWDRRGTEWAFQLQTATLDINRINQEIASKQTLLQIETDDYNNQNLLITNAAAVQNLLQSKFTNQQLYAWMVDQSATTYFQCYQAVYGMAKALEASFRFELGLQSSTYINFGYWDSSKNGLLAGEKLYLDLKRLENAYITQNQRHYEITKTISLVLLDPGALISLKLTGQCLITLPEALFDMDYPGHYLRRIKTIGLTIPCVTGPYTSVNCTLTLLQSKIRMTAAGATRDAYPEQPIASDPRFSYDFAATQSIATSTAQNDSGMFEVDFNDDRLFPFEGYGVIAQLLVSMPPDCNAWDFDTMNDLLLNIRYTSKPGGPALAEAAKYAAVLPPRPTQTPGTTTPAFPTQNNLLRLFSLRHEYPTEWYKFLSPPIGTSSTTPISTMQINLGNERFPFQFRGKGTPNITQAELVAIFCGPVGETTPTLHLQLFPPTVAAGSYQPTQSIGNAQTLTILNPLQPAPPPSTPGSQSCWILQCSDAINALTPKINDIYLICEFTAQVNLS